jgi:hypothetical protein
MTVPVPKKAGKKAFEILPPSGKPGELYFYGTEEKMALYFCRFFGKTLST